jgi:hypothetical protein
LTTCDPYTSTREEESRGASLYPARGGSRIDALEDATENWHDASRASTGMFSCLVTKRTDGIGEKGVRAEANDGNHTVGGNEIGTSETVSIAMAIGCVVKN